MCTIARWATRLESLAHVILRDDGYLLLEISVAAGVVAVIVRVDDEAHRLFGDAFQCGLNLLRERSILIIHNHNAVVADRRANVPSRALEHVHVAGHFRDLDLHFAEILVLSHSHSRNEEQTSRQNGCHVIHPFLFLNAPGHILAKSVQVSR
jgi:hypothetical protein